MIEEVHGPSQGSRTALEWADQFFVGYPQIEVLFSNMLPEAVDAGEQKITLSWSDFFITSAERTVQGSTFCQLLEIRDDIIYSVGFVRLLNILDVFIFI